jgi:uncharacterized alkaline shock family protein YloU
MADEIQLEGLAISPDVLTTIVTVAATDVEGVACVDGGTTLSTLGKPKDKSAPKGTVVAIADDGTLSVSLHVRLNYGQPLREVATRVQQTVGEALASMTGQRVASVDVYVDGIVFPG